MRYNEKEKSEEKEIEKRAKKNSVMARATRSCSKQACAVQMEWNGSSLTIWKRIVSTHPWRSRLRSQRKPPILPSSAKMCWRTRFVHFSWFHDRVVSFPKNAPQKMTIRGMPETESFKKIQPRPTSQAGLRADGSFGSTLPGAGLGADFRRCQNERLIQKA